MWRCSRAYTREKNTVCFHKEVFFFVCFIIFSYRDVYVTCFVSASHVTFNSFGFFLSSALLFSYRLYFSVFFIFEFIQWRWFVCRLSWPFFSPLLFHRRLLLFLLSTFVVRVHKILLHLSIVFFFSLFFHSITNGMAYEQWTTVLLLP